MVRKMNNSKTKKKKIQEKEEKKSIGTKSEYATIDGSHSTIGRERGKAE